MPTTRVDIEFGVGPQSASRVEASLHTGDFHRGVFGQASTGSTGTSHSILLPDGADIVGRAMLIVIGHDNNTPVDLAADLVALGYTQLAGDSWPPDYDWDILWRVIDGTEPYDGIDDTIELTTASTTDVVTIALLFDIVYGGGVGAFWDSIVAFSANPGSLDPSWATTESAFWLTALLADAVITGDPTGYTMYGNAIGGSLHFRASGKYDDSVTEDPSTYTSAGAILCWTIVIRGVSEGTTTTPTVVESSVHTGTTVAGVTNTVVVESSVHTGDVEAEGGG